MKKICKFLLKATRLLFGLFALAAICVAIASNNPPVAIAWGLVLYFHIRLIHLEKDREVLAKDVSELLKKNSL